MPSVFLCHASEDKSTVESVQMALVNAGCKVFYDERSLPPGGDFQARIQRAIAECDIFVFLASRASIAPGKYTLTELGFIRDRWPSPVGRVLPVLTRELHAQDLPAYLQAATVLKVTGNLAAETRAAVESMLRTASRRRATVLSIALAGCAIAAALFVLPPWSRSPTLPSPLAPADRREVPETISPTGAIAQSKSEPSRDAGQRQAEAVKPLGPNARSNIPRGKPIIGPSQPTLDYALNDPSPEEIDRFVRQNFPDGTRFTPIGFGRVESKSNDHYTQILRIGTLDSQGIARSEDARITFIRNSNEWKPRNFEILK